MNTTVIYGAEGLLPGLTTSIHPQRRKDMENEVRTKNPITGGEKGQKLARYDLIPVKPLRVVAEHYGRGAAKYAERNWERGYDWSLSYAALQRHAQAFWGGEDNDPETNTPHLAAVVFHALALLEYGETHPELDDRPGAVERRVEKAIHAVAQSFETGEGWTYASPS